MQRKYIVSAGIFLLVCFLSCGKTEEILPIAGNATVADQSENAFGNAVPGLTHSELDAFAVGNSFFRNNWVVAPASATARDGLGPVFNALSCGSCHHKDGRGKPPENGTDFLGLLFRVQTADLSPDPIYGGQIQVFSIPGVPEEVTPGVTYEYINGTYPDGTPYALRKPVYQFSDWKYGTPDPTIRFSARVAPQMPGVGLLEAIPDARFYALADENDANGDGISGRFNLVWDPVAQTYSLGRFGWKAGQPSLHAQTAKAFNEDIGITSWLFPQSLLSAAQETQIGNLPNGGEPEISTFHLNQVVFYCQALAVPARRNPYSPSIQSGASTFEEIGCGKCHANSVETGYYNAVPQLSNQLIFPYTDLLLHDMGDGLADGFVDHLATGNEWKTPPLWGIGLLQTVNGHQYLLHDGRARNVEEAILWHGGEAESAKNKFMQLSGPERDALIQFIQDL